MAGSKLTSAQRLKLAECKATMLWDFGFKCTIISLFYGVAVDLESLWKKVIFDHEVFPSLQLPWSLLSRSVAESIFNFIAENIFWQWLQNHLKEAFCINCHINISTKYFLQPSDWILTYMLERLSYAFFSKVKRTL